MRFRSSPKHDFLKPCRDRALHDGKQKRERVAKIDPGKKGAYDHLYFLCRKPWQVRFMIQFDQCDELHNG
ncbi:hypothetical protein DPMN_131719 [Dreissena polymorpha]|uniref:Uncharacterized protein n=1 Tax=Dreissena polymorpha TaxID=45954 RepID=A0A9D4FUI2_DREPO|nr:hypothetical protein DPMN_131719 [Dreissena polymorpha]